jgi:hypothetical protein
MPTPENKSGDAAPSDHLQDLAKMIRELDDLAKDDSGSIPPSTDDKAD